MKNLRFFYLYRDGDNHKKTTSIVLNGGLPEAEVAQYQAQLEACFDQDEYFIADQIGVPEVFLYGEDADYEYDDQSDHCWHEFDGLELVDAESTIALSPVELLSRVQQAAAEGWNDQTTPA